jgi:group I intron endonuclease
MIIYEAINKINGKRYIGQTIYSLNHRKKQHLSSIKYNTTGCTLFKRAIKKYGSNNFEWKVIDSAKSHAELDAKESFWISFFGTTNPIKGYNLKGGGAKPFLTDRTKKAIGNAQRGSLNHMYGIRGKDNPSSIPVIDITTGERFDSVTHLCKEKPIFDISKVCAVCRGDRYTYKSHVFRYLNNDGSIRENGVPTDINEIKRTKSKHVSKNPISHPIEDMTNHIVYQSITDAVGKRYKSNICRKLKRENGECDYHGIHWKLL